MDKKKIIDGLKFVAEVLGTLPVTEIKHCDMKVKAFVNVNEIIKIIESEGEKEE